MRISINDKQPSFPRLIVNRLGEILPPGRAQVVRIRAWLKRYDVWCRSKRKSKGRHARTKGASFEREIATALRPIFPDARRQLENHVKDANGVDIMYTGVYRFQCKRNIGYAPISALSEIKFEACLGEVPVLVTQADKCEALAVLPFAELLRLLLVEQDFENGYT